MFLGQKGLELPRTALITTEGFRDVLEIARQRRPELYNVFYTKPKPLVPRKYRFTVSERIDPWGKIIKPLDPGEVEKLADKIREAGVEAVAVSLLNSYTNSIHEELVGKILGEKLRGTYIVLSSRVDPEYREYERTSTTVVNAVLMPVLSRYLRGLEEELSNRKLYSGTILVMKSDGGFASSREAQQIPAAVIESGPAAGVVAATYYSRLLGLDKVLSFDMGGTTAKAATITGGEPLKTSEFEVGGKANGGRIIKGSGYPVRYPHIDLAEVSAGGGTIAWVDEAGHLRVGPLSAGSDPGPVCYRRGGTEPTVTDANLLLGRLGEVLAGGTIRLDRDLAYKVFHEKIVEKTGLGFEEAAYGVLKLVNVRMARAVRIVTIERGLDPREYTLIAYGGAGPMHAVELAEELGIKRVLVPVYPGLFSALGLLLSDYRYEYKKSILKTLGEIDPVELEEKYEFLEKEAYETLRREGVDEKNIIIHRKADMRYKSQSYELVVDVPEYIDGETIGLLEKKFYEKHRETYGYHVEDDEVVLVNARITAIGVAKKPKIIRRGIGEWKKKHIADSSSIRKTYFKSVGWIETPVYIREKLVPGDIIEGPAVVEEYDSTIIVPPEWVLRVNEYYFLEIVRGGEG